MKCNKCDEEFKGIEEWQHHTAEHLMGIANMAYEGWNGSMWWKWDNDGESGNSVTHGDALERASSKMSVHWTVTDDTGVVLTDQQDDGDAHPLPTTTAFSTA